MSSRAIRRVQKEREEQARASNFISDDDSSDDAPRKSPTGNAFNMLAEFDNEELEPSDSTGSDNDDMKETNHDDAANSTPSKSKMKKQSRKKKKKKSKAMAGQSEKMNSEGENLRPRRKASQLDEIDLALKSLSMSSKDSSPRVPPIQLDEGKAQLNRLLAVESKHLNALNEMKRLFGNIVLEGEGGGAAISPGRRRRRGLQELDLAEALTGRHSPASNGQGLSGLALRRNFFMTGKEEWPKAMNTGLSMDSDRSFGGYRFHHTSAYRSIQVQFEAAVASMDPHRIIELLRFNPYHISTLLQVSEIAKQQGDHSVSGDLLERALFSFGRAVDSSFTIALSHGKARLDFRRPENREFWLAVWRYIINLCQRGTWQTAYEWARLLLSLDPENDPYRVVLIVDQLALRAGQPEHFLKLSGCSFFQERWRYCPNIQISSALAKLKVNEAANSRIKLARCVQQYPWIFVGLFTELNISPVPPSIWGKEARSEREKFESGVYIIHAKDLWNTPEAKSFLVEVTKSVTVNELPKPRSEQVNTDEVRHVLLSGNQAMIGLISNEFTSLSTSASDPLPPSDNSPSYIVVDEGSREPIPPSHHGDVETLRSDELRPESTNQEEIPVREGNLDIQGQTDHVEGFAVLQFFLSNLLPWTTHITEDGPESNADTGSVSQRLAEFVQFGSRIPEHLAARGRRLVEALREALRRGWAEDSGPWEMRYLTDRLEEALAAREPEDLEPINPPAPTPGPAQHDYEADDRLLRRSYPSDPENPPEEDDDVLDEEEEGEDRNQHWLAGRGMLRLREFTNQYGADEAAWSDIEIETEGKTLVHIYADRVLRLSHPGTQRFIVDYVLRQGTNTDVRDLVMRAIEKIKSERGQDVNT